MALSTLNPSLPALEDLITYSMSSPSQKDRPAAHPRYPTRYPTLTRTQGLREALSRVSFSHDKLRRVVKEAWEAVWVDEVLALVREM